jgi:hypothetical protein
LTEDNSILSKAEGKGWFSDNESDSLDILGAVYLS